HGVGQRRVRRFVGEVFATSEKTKKGAALLRDVIANGAGEHRVGGFERVQHGALRGRRVHFQLQFAADAGERAQMRRQHDADLVGRVCTWTESTAGKSWTMADQWSPPSGETYTWPPVVPK